MDFTRGQLALQTGFALKSDIPQILIVKPSSLGDIVHTLPAVAAIKQQRPDSRISWIVNTEWAPLLAGNPFVDEVIDFPRRDFRGIAGWLRIVSI